MPINFHDVSFIYNRKSPLEYEALKDVSLDIENGSFVALVGRTGCGKSTLIQHINALLNPTSGEVKVDDFCNSSDKKKRTKKTKELRRHVGLVFQFPEYQLFEDTVEKDVAYGPKNFGMKGPEALEEAHKALRMVGLDESFDKRSPLELSGGEKRRVAIAGILAYRPSYLIIDEPTAGLDPAGALVLMDLFEKIHQEGTTIILVTHDMNLVLRYCDKVIVMDQGKIARISTPVELFSEDMERFSLETPLLYSFITQLKQKGMKLDEGKIVDCQTLAKQIASNKEKTL